jgi:esterase/lipase superfamily enzyme
MKNLGHFFAGFLLTVAFAWSASSGSQTATGTIVGRVVDDKGAAVPNAEVNLMDVVTEMTRNTTSNSEGEYRFTDVPPAKYGITASAEGFMPGVIEIEVAVGAAARADFTLDIRRTVYKDGSEPKSSHKSARKSAKKASSDKVYKETSRSPASEAPAPAAPPPPPPPPTAKADGAGLEKHFTLVKVFYATDRRPTGLSEPARFYSGERGADESLSLGVCEVSVPHDHRMGHLEKPSIWKFQFHEDPEKHVVLLSVKPEEHDEFLHELSATVGTSQGKEAFVFIHGYNVTFEDAARRTAQMWFDLKFDGAAILYSWPSKGTLSKYLADEASVEWTAPHLKKFLEEIAANSQASTVHLIAHSMGNRPLTAALKAIAAGASPSTHPEFRQVILTAPDIDAGVFRQLAQDIQKTAERVTLYASSLDKALAASRKIHEYQRAGESGAEITVVRGVDTIDVSAVDTGLLGHSYFGEKRSVISDMYYLLKDGKPPGQRSGLEERRQHNEVYWTFVP